MCQAQTIGGSDQAFQRQGKSFWNMMRKASGARPKTKDQRPKTEDRKAL